MKPLEDAKKLADLTPQVGGVFTTADLQTVFQARQGDNFRRRVRNLESAGLLQRFSRGYYLTPGANLWVLSQRLYPNSYISCANILARELIIGTEPGSQVTSVKVGKGRSFSGPVGKIVHLGIAPHLFFGFKAENGVQVADREKALLDTLYFYQKGRRYYFDLYSDIDRSAFDRAKINSYLRRYRNPKFINFVKGFLS